MKRIEAIIKPFKLSDVREAINEAGVHGMTVLDVIGYGRAAHNEIYRGSEYKRESLPMVMIIDRWTPFVRPRGAETKL